MRNTDQNFPLITYLSNKSSKEWGQFHGEEFRTGIKELVAIRRELMLNKNPKLKDSIDDLALQQFNVSKEFSTSLSEELSGIAEGSGLSLSDIVVLNNYTDFRDLNMPEEGCSTVHIQSKDSTLAGQTWDMHGSAKNYVCLIKTPLTEQKPASIIFSLVGCVGMMGFNSNKLSIGVNNINTRNAKVGLIWPVLVRKVLEQKSFDDMRNTLTNAPVTSGHNYLLSSEEVGEHWEVSPGINERVLNLEKGQLGNIFHTNHCMGEQTIAQEDTTSSSSTTHDRFKLLDKKLNSIQTHDQFEGLLTDHENYPKSICSHFESGAQDPSFTCGGGIGDFSHNKYSFWRGCPKEDANYKKYQFQLAFNKDAKLGFDTID